MIKTVNQTRDNHPRRCHRCKYDGKGDSACLTCPGFVDVGQDGRDVVYSSEIVEKAADTASPRSFFDEPERGDGYLPRLRVLLAEFSQMSPRGVLILHGLLNGKSLSDLARDFGQSRALVHHELKRTIERFPWLSALHYAIPRQGITAAASEESRRRLKGWRVPEKF